MKLEVGNYVRTEKGKIDKIIGFDGALILFLYDLVYGYIDENDIIKASNNIIDLIEVGDIIVDDFTLQPKKVSKVSLNDDYIYCNCDMEKISPECIKSIVTKEQFESMQYKVD